MGDGKGPGKGTKGWGGMSNRLLSPISESLLVNKPYEQMPPRVPALRPAAEVQSSVGAYSVWTQ